MGTTLFTDMPRGIAEAAGPALGAPPSAAACGATLLITLTLVAAAVTWGILQRTRRTL